MARVVDSITLPVGPSVKNFWQRTRAGLEKGKRPTVEIPVNPNLKRANAELAAWRKRQEANALNIPVEIDQRQVKSSIRRVETIFKQSDLSKAIRINIAVAGAAALPALAQGALSATTALTRLGQAALVLPGVFSGVAAAVGALVTGLSDIGRAFDAANDGMKDAAQNARDYQRASRDLEKAQRDVVQALKQANRELQDQKDKLTEGALSVEQAQINLAKAQERLAKGGFDSWTDLRQAMLDVKTASFDLNQAVKDNNRNIQDYRENAGKSATQTDTFKDALDRLTTATENFSKAQNTLLGRTDEFLEAMAKLSPAGRDFVDHVLALRGAWDELAKAVQTDLLTGLGQEITNLATKRLPLLQTGLQRVAKGLNTNFKTILQSLGSEQNANAISRIFEHMGVALQRANPGITSFLNAFIKLSEVGSRFLPRLANAFNTVMARFENFVNRAAEDGSLERWIDRGLQVLSSLGNAIIHIGSILNSLSEAYEKATGNVGGFATTAEQGLGRLAEYLKSPEGQQTLVNYLQEAREFLNSIKDAMPGIIDLFQTLADGLREYARFAFPIFGAIGTFLRDHIDLVKSLLAWYVTFRTLKPIAKHISGFWQTATAAARRYKEMQDAALDRLAKQRNLQAEALQLEQKAIRDQRRIAREVKQEQLQAQAHLSSTKLAADSAVNVAQRELDAKRELVELAREERTLANQSYISAKRNLQLMAENGLVIEETLKKAEKERKILNTLEGRRRKLVDTGEKIESGALVDLDVSADAVRKKGTKKAAAREAVEAELQALDKEIEDRRANLQVFTSDIERMEAERQKAYTETEKALDRKTKAHDQVKKAEADEVAASKRLTETRRTSIGSVVKAQNELADVHKRTSADMQTANNNVRIATDNVKTSTKQLSEAAKEAAGFNGGIGRLRRAIGARGGGGLAGVLGGLATAMGAVKTAIGSVGATVGLLYGLDKLAENQRKAGDAAEYHRQRVAGLRNELDQTTGAVTEAGKSAALRDAQSFQVRGDSNNMLTVNALEASGRLNIDKETFRQSLDPQQIQAINQVQQAADNDTLAAIRAGKDEQWNRYGAELKKRGVDEKTYALAINGDPDSVAKFEAAAKDFFRSKGDVTGTGRFVPEGVRINLGRGAENLINAGVAGPAVGQFQRSTLEANRLGGENVKAAGTPAALKPGNPFNKYGPTDIFIGPDGESVSFNITGVSPDEANRLTNGDPNNPSSDTFALTPLNRAAGRYAVTLTGEQLHKYVEGFARGGRVWGAGTATSDSIPAMLSNGEFVLNSKAADYYGPATLYAMNRMELPKLDEGGFPPNDPKVNPLEIFYPFGPVGKGGLQINPAPGGATYGVGAGLTAPKPLTPKEVSDKLAGLPGSTAAKPSTLPQALGLPTTKVMTPTEVQRSQTAKDYILQGVASIPGFLSGDRGPDALINAGKAIVNSFSPGLIGEPAPRAPARAGQPSSLIGSSAALNAPPGASLFGGAASKVGENQYRGPQVTSEPATKPLPPGAAPPKQSVPTIDHGNKGSFQPGPGGASAAPGQPGVVTPTQIQPTTINTPPPSSTSRVPTYEDLGTETEIPSTGSTAGAVIGPDGVVYVPDLSGSGALPDYDKTGRSAAANAPINPQANILDYLRQLAQAHGLSVGSGHRDENNSQHSVNRALDIGNLDQAQKGQISAFVKEWMADPSKVAATRQLIFRGPDGDYGIINGRVLGPDEVQQVYGRALPNHANHVHLALEGVPLSAFAPDGSGAPIAGAGVVPVPAPVGPDGAPVAPVGPDGSIVSQAPQIPGVNAPIQGPFGPIPFQPFDFLKVIGQEILKAILGFFGIDISPIVNIINGISSGIGNMQQQQVPVEPAATEPTPEDYIQQLVDQAREAKAAGNEPLARSLLSAASEYEKSLAAGDAAIAGEQPQADMALPTTVGIGPINADSPPGDIAKYIYQTALAKGYSPDEALAIVAHAIGESGLNPRISGGIQGDDEVIGIFQEKAAFADGASREQRMDPVFNINKYFEKLLQHRDVGDIVNQLAATSVGGPAHPSNGGRPYIEKLKARARELLGMAEGGYLSEEWDWGEWVDQNYGSPWLGAIHNAMGGLVPGYFQGDFVGIGHGLSASRRPDTRIWDQRARAAGQRVRWRMAQRHMADTMRAGGGFIRFAGGGAVAPLIGVGAEGKGEKVFVWHGPPLEADYQAQRATETGIFNPLYRRDTFNPNIRLDTSRVHTEPSLNFAAQYQNRALEGLRRLNQRTDGFFGLMPVPQLWDSFLQNMKVDPYSGGTGWQQRVDNILGFRRGGHVRGPGGPTDDKIPALLSDGEFVMRAAAVKHYGTGALVAMNNLQVPRMATGGFPTNIPFLQPLPNQPPPGPLPLPSPGQPTVGGAAAGPQGGGPQAPGLIGDAAVGPPAPPPAPGQPLIGDAANPPAFPGAPPPGSPLIGNAAAPQGLQQALGSLGSALGGLFAPKGGGVANMTSAPSSQDGKDPRSILGAAPTNLNHNHPALDASIQGAFQTIGSLAAQGAAMGLGALNIVAPGAGSAAGSAAASAIQGAAQIGGQAAAGVANVISSLLVGTVTPGTTGQGYGAPLIPAQPAPTVPVQNIDNSTINAYNIDEAYRAKERKAAQQTLPWLNRVPV